MIIDGKAIANEKAKDLRSKIKDLKKKPKLAIVLIGDDPASKIYVNLKVKKAQELGIETEVVDSFEKVSPDAAGIILQLPCENSQEIIQKIPLDKDVDGLREGSPFLPATVKAVLTILDRFRVKPEMTHVVVGQGRLIGKPLYEFLKSKGLKVIKCDTKTPNLKEETLKGDILVVATGIKNLVKKDMVKPGAIIIDCGSPRPEVDSGAYEVASAYTPVPGGIGPLTVISLLENFVEAVKMTP